MYSSMYSFSRAPVRLIRPSFHSYRSAEIGVVEVLAAPGRVDARGPHLRRRARRDPDIAPRRRDHKLFDPGELRLVLDLFSAESK
jgi:hypothetical protein